MTVILQLKSGNLNTRIIAVVLHQHNIVHRAGTHRRGIVVAAPVGATAAMMTRTGTSASGVVAAIGMKIVSGMEKIDTRQFALRVVMVGRQRDNLHQHANNEHETHQFISADIVHTSTKVTIIFRKPTTPHTFFHLIGTAKDRPRQRTEPRRS